jgi:hypothetical protein
MALILNEFSAPEDFSTRLATAPKVRSPRATEDVILHADWTWSNVLLVKHENKYFLVKAALAALLTGHLFRGVLHAAASNAGEVFVWPVRMGTTAVEAANAAVGKWVRISWVNISKNYAVQDASEQHKAPDWRYASFDQLVEIAFAGRVLDDPASPVVKAILGQKT